MVVSKPNYDVRSFAIRRVFRIYPLWWIVMSIGLGTFFWQSWFRADAEALGTAGIVKSYLLLPQKTYPFINVGWSLEYELIFYAIVAVLLPFIRLWGIALTCFGLCAAELVFKPTYGFRIIDNSYLFFGVGIIAYFVRHYSWRTAFPIAIIGCGLAYARFFEAIAIRIDSAYIALAVGFAALLVTVLSLERSGWKAPRIVVAIGDASYSLYLWHWLLIPVLGRLRWKGFDMAGSPELWRWVLVILSIVVALLSYRFLELPTIAVGERLARRCVQRNSSS